MSSSDELLHEAIEGRIVPGPAHGGVASLARLAGRMRRVAVPGPDAAAMARMAARFDELIEGRRVTGMAVWLLGWLGAGPRPRAVVQQFAAGALLVVAATTGAGAAAGHSPVETFEGIGRFAVNAVANLDPRAGDGAPGSVGDPEVESERAAPAESRTPAPRDAAAASATPAPGTPTPSTADGAATVPPAPSPAAGQDQQPETPPAATPVAAITPSPTPTTAPASPSPEATPPKPAGTPASTETPKASSSPSPTPSGTPRPSPSPTGTPPGQAYSAGEAGMVTLRVVGNALDIVSVQPASGWTVTTQQESGPEVEVVFKKGDRKIEFKASLHDGKVTANVEEDGSEEGGG